MSNPWIWYNPPFIYSSLISFSNLLYFFTIGFLYILGYFYDTIFKLKKLLFCLLWIYRNTVHFCIMTLCPVVSLNSFIHIAYFFFFFFRLFRKIVEWQPEEYLSGLMMINSHSLYFCENIYSSLLFMKDIFSIYRICDVRFFYFHL